MASFGSTPNTIANIGQQGLRHSASNSRRTETLLSNRPPQPIPSSHASDAIDAAQVLLGPSLAMSNLWSRLQRVAPYFRTALLTGESGCGQQAVARALHQLSPLNSRSFAVIPAAEADARLAQQDGWKASAALGMIYLPDPDRLSAAAQAGLLRLLRERGATAPRLVTFAENGLRSLISACGFCPELANSLGALQIEVPALRDRAQDISLLAGHLLRAEAENLGLPIPGLSDDLLQTAEPLPWPGNLAQMQAAFRWILERQHGEVLQEADLQNALAAMTQTPAPTAPEARLVRLDQVIREQVHSVLMACNGNKLRAAEILGISRSTLYRMLNATGSIWPPA
jgi:DNA-binding NtrC family response regulator